MNHQNNSHRRTSKLKFEQIYVIWGLWLFLFAALLGTSMRLFWVIDLPFFEYTNVLHAHSHLAMLGWGFTVICALFIFFLKGLVQKPKSYRLLLLINVLVCLVMTVAFVVDGYTVLSISLLTAHLLIAYRLGYLLLQDLKRLTYKTASLLGRWAIYWMFISTLGVWFLPVVIAKFGKFDPLYFASIELFLHLQFNGWFVFAILAFLVLTLEQKRFILKITKFEFWMLQISLVLTYGLPAFWSYPIPVLSHLNALGVVVQLLVLGKLLYPLLKSWKVFQRDEVTIGDGLIVIGVVSLLIKTIIQFTLILPSFLGASSEVRQFFIGFIHLIMLGVFTMTCLGVCVRNGIIPQVKLSKLGLQILILGFISTELILFTQGLLLWNVVGAIPYYHEVILIFTIFLPVGIALVIASIYSTSSKKAANILS
ncbi:hypothetical protein LV84_03286 [Algoriphagus ratkowskyi]|uniref:Uncharacterized protein n=1 Tax=Algoriphagus ratkowskyi TaxID=57028 RepID=A0A2W7SQU1_9BACT|nr:hypothetical protein [Algoriphagus ratkowskyi]PZX53082.1 hypothetical protein LV84_03286 [Algoriphagus ratkowskyi]TXD76362.1 hypothetical protein ESW18_16580 [Algoriphagus ratkowskyi]